MEQNGNQNLPPVTFCRTGCGFYGNPAFDGLCSKCYKDALKRKNNSSSPVSGRLSPVSPGEKESTVSSVTSTLAHASLGVQRRMRHLSPFTVFVSCRNHRLALCLAHLIKRFTILQDVDATLLSLWKLFEFSPQKMAVFKHVQTVYGKTPLIITRAATTRWLSHLQACSRFVNRYECILDTLDGIYEEKRDPEVMGIRGNTTNKMIVATILLLCDILKPVNMLSLYLQESNIRFTSLPNHVKLTTDLLHGLIETYQEHIDSDTLNTTDTEFSKCQNIFDEIDDRTDLARRLRVNQHVDQTASPKSFLRETGTSTECSSASSISSTIVPSGTFVSEVVTSTTPSIETATPTVSVPSGQAKVEPEKEEGAVGGAEVGTDSSSQSDDDKDKKPKKNRCHTCKKKVGLTGFPCRCGGLYCSIHRYSDKHECKFNYKEMAQEHIRKHNPVIVAEKIQKI